ncbi:MAG: nucleoside kinase [Clostridia bacterium]|nr:nucleoside kinase [Clostridia bacterium]
MKTALKDINNSAKTNTDAYIEECEKRFDDDVNRVVSTFLADSRCDIVLLAGPSSSGKTTTAGKIADKIRQSGRNAFIVSLDDFYLNRDDIPDGEDGLKDFENVTALDIDLIHSVFSELIENRRAELPLYDFKTGSRSDETKRIELGESDVIVVEGLHALNPVITDGLDESHLYRIYISVSSRVLGQDGEILLNKRNLRLIRRMIRDSKHRNVRAESTFNQWPSVLRGEDKYLFPFESYADVKINSFHPYELCIFKQQALEQLDTIESDSVFYEKASEIKRIFELVESIEPSLLPDDSLLCEFLR